MSSALNKNKMIKQNKTKKNTGSLKIYIYTHTHTHTHTSLWVRVYPILMYIFSLKINPINITLKQCLNYKIKFLAPEYDECWTYIANLIKEETRSSFHIFNLNIVLIYNFIPSITFENLRALISVFKRYFKVCPFFGHFSSSFYKTQTYQVTKIRLLL